MARDSGTLTCPFTDSIQKKLGEFQNARKEIEDNSKN
ncbi:uncharacterized protein RSE6_01597 [Rhynchosporium secalis]|uniref:Uncharacterized protein n=1 Tax=Rhynchosporium secalis TaxID=38038 RepID=A0A1E1LY58_RHYSE|nr:uncharacterized protein RSE6_01597 [Rhynchosporium secalis]